MILLREILSTMSVVHYSFHNLIKIDSNERKTVDLEGIGQDCRLLVKLMIIQKIHIQWEVNRAAS